MHRGTVATPTSKGMNMAKLNKAVRQQMLDRLQASQDAISGNQTIWQATTVSSGYNTSSGVHSGTTSGTMWPQYAPQTLQYTTYPTIQYDADEWEIKMEEKEPEVEPQEVVPGSLDMTKKRDTPRLLGAGPITKELREKMENVAHGLGKPKAPEGGFLVNDPQEELKKAFQAHRSAQSIRSRKSVGTTPSFGLTSTTSALVNTTNVTGIGGAPVTHKHIGSVGTQEVKLSKIGPADFQQEVYNRYYQYDSSPFSQITVKWDKSNDHYVFNAGGLRTSVVMDGEELRVLNDSCLLALGAPSPQVPGANIQADKEEYLKKIAEAKKRLQVEIKKAEVMKDVPAKKSIWEDMKPW